MGNHPSVDLTVTSPNGVAFSIDVKGLYRKNYWVVKTKPEKANLFYVFAFVPDDAPNEFFILTQAAVNAEIKAENERARLRAIARGNPNGGMKFECIGWKAAENHRDWKVLPE